MTRDEHLAWCKQRALQYVDSGDLSGGLTSMLSDLRKHDETKEHSAIQLTDMLMLSGFLSSPADVRRHIEGFN